jgi:hypothetical protein
VAAFPVRQEQASARNCSNHRRSYAYNECSIQCCRSLIECCSLHTVARPALGLDGQQRGCQRSQQAVPAAAAS